MSSISYRLVDFNDEIVHFEDLIIIRSALITALPRNWYYLGPIATTPENPDTRGLVVRANVPDALCDIVDWIRIFVDIESGRFSTWRGIPENPEKYAAIGDFFVKGIEKPSPQLTEGIKAIRKDLIQEVEPHHLVYKKVIPFATLTLWNVFATIPLLIPTGAFVSVQGDNADNTKLGVIRFHPGVQELAEGEE